MGWVEGGRREEGKRRGWVEESCGEGGRGRGKRKEGERGRGRKVGV